MILIRTAEALARALAQPELKCLLQVQADRLAEYNDYDLSELGMFAIIQAGDALHEIDQAIGWSLLKGDTFAKPVELIARHSNWYEMTFILSDDGFGLVLFVPINADSKLIAACNRALTD